MKNEAETEQKRPQKSKSHLCRFCAKNFSRRSNLQHHLEAGHFKVRKFRCKLCSKTFASDPSLRTHIETVHLGRKYQCNFCDKRYTQEHVARDHYERVHLKKVFPCKICKKEFTFRCSLGQHVRTQHGDGKTESKTNNVNNHGRQWQTLPVLCQGIHK